jgi:hypothetical protein
LIELFRKLFTHSAFLLVSMTLCVGQSIAPQFIAPLAHQPVRAASSSASAAISPAKLPVVSTTVRVTADPSDLSTEHPSPFPFHAIAEDILPSAGTYGDFSRYLQVFPGVVGNGDYSNDLIVRGGNPIENLYLVDGFEVPNISQISIEGTSGGMSTMIDTAAIAGVDLYTGGYDASFDERLSSVVDIRTRRATGAERHGEFEAGYIGAGGLVVAPLGSNGSILGAAHQSFLNLIDQNIGLGGTPIYNNMLWTGEINPNASDELSFLSLSGFDSIKMEPGGPGHDCVGTSQIDMQYTGWRMTNGLRWRHTYSPHSFGVVTLTDSEDQENIQQEDTLFDVVSIGDQNPQTLPPVLVYSQVSHDGRASTRYDITYDSGRHWALIAGTTGYLNHVDYAVAQPEGEQSPLSLNPAATDATSFAPDFLSGETGSYAELTLRPVSRWSMSAGGRMQTFSLGGHQTATPRLNTAIKISQHTGLHAAFGDYAQMPPTVDVVSWPQNHFLDPARVRHLVAGADLYSGPGVHVAIEAYEKNYRDYPVSSQYPSLSLANMVDDLGQQMLWIPLISQGTGVARGVELSATGHIGRRFTSLVNLAYARSEYAGMDRVLRPGNFDYPVVLNTSGTYRTPRRYEFSWRYSYTSGKPYTPFLLQQSMEQNRPIYNLSKINGVRGPVYSRLDYEMDRSFRVGDRRLVAYLGLDNATNHKNFLGYFWMPRIDAYWGCYNNPANCLTEVDSFSIYPDGGLRYTF